VKPLHGGAAPKPPFLKNIASKSGTDLDAMFADWQKKQSGSGREVVSLPPKPRLKLQQPIQT